MALQSIHQRSGSHTVLYLCCLIFIALPRVSRGSSSHSSPKNRTAKVAQDSTIPALLVSDIHFDPFHDPAKVPQLVTAPVDQWKSILSGQPSPNQQQAFAELQQSCHARGVDTPYTLLRSSLSAMRSRLPDAKFMTVSGDLIAHEFTCRYKTIFPRSTTGEYRKFVLKTIRFVLGQLRGSFQGVPIYVALGNNDTPCGDYRLDGRSDFLASTGRILAKGLPPSDRQRELNEFAEDGSYSLTMAAPMRNTRLIVLNDLFLSSKYNTCDRKQDSSAANLEMAWLRNQLAQARRMGQKVWVMGHIPTGIDPYSTMRYRDVCAHQAPVVFLSSPKLAELLIEYADVIRLGIFAHTHMDEIRLLEPESKQLGASQRMVAIKMVASISPVDGNNPSFTIAHVDPASAVLQDYEVIAASNHTGVGATWSEEYDFRRAYHEAQFTPAAVKALIGKFAADPQAKTEASRQYIRYYYIGDRSPELSPFWPEYVCALSNYTAQAYTACACSRLASAEKSASQGVKRATNPPPPVRASLR